MKVLDRIDRVPVRLVITTGNDPFQNAIRLATRSDATHAAIGVGDQLLHAYENGVLLEPRAAWFGEREQSLVAEYHIIPDVTDGLHEALAHLGKRYDVVHVVKIGLLRLFPRAKLKPEDDARFTCARFVMKIDDGTQIPEWRGISREAVVPRDLMEAADSGPSFYRVA